jgi:predicted TIM-barrel fold metal-dependent hydrolase
VDGKIAIEEHFVTPELEHVVSNPGWPPDMFRSVLDALADTDGRLAEMDRCGVGMAVLSLASNGIQDEVDAARAAEVATAANDALAAVVAAHSDRYAAFAAVALQDAEAAAAEAERAVRDLGMRGVLVNGYSSVGDLDTAAYYDEPRFEPFWARLEALGVPFYLHPRNPLPTQRRIYEGRPELLGPTWAFAVETATHALRLITSGLFDRHPDLRVILGHQGEGLPFAMKRLEQRLSRRADVSLERPPTEVLRECFHITTSGNYDTASLVGLLLEVGADRVIFAADYPFEELEDGTRWMDSVPISETDRVKIGRTNAARLLGLDG